MTAALTALSRAVDYAELVIAGGVDHDPDEDGVSPSDWLSAVHGVVPEASAWHRSLEADLGVFDDRAILDEIDRDLQSQDL